VVSGSVEALTLLLKENSVPVRSSSIGCIKKKDLIKCTNANCKNPEYAVILAFNIDISKDIRTEAKQLGIKIFESNILYQLIKAYLDYLDNIRNEKLTLIKSQINFPCELLILQTFNNKSPIIIGVKVIKGVVTNNTELKYSNDLVGKIVNIQKDNKSIKEAGIGDEVCIEIVQLPNQKQYVMGRSLHSQDTLMSKLTHENVELLEKYFPTIYTENKELINKILS
jgi:translation initiation factor 5B